MALYGETSQPRKSLRDLGGMGTLGFFCHNEYPKFTGEEG